MQVTRVGVMVVVAVAGGGGVNTAFAFVVVGSAGVFGVCSFLFFSPSSPSSNSTQNSAEVLYRDIHGGNLLLEIQTTSSSSGYYLITHCRNLQTSPTNHNFMHGYARLYSHYN